MPCSPAREPKRFCFVQPGTAPDRDDAAHILDSFHKCNDGGTVVLDQSYLIGSPLDLTFLKHIDVVITGEIHFDASDVYCWAENSFKYDFQNQSVYWKWGGEDVNIYGDLSREKSVIDGHGQPYWEEIQTNKSVSKDFSYSGRGIVLRLCSDICILQLRRPMLFAFDGMEGATMSNLRMRNSPHVRTKSHLTSRAY
jgi:galacturan 1,4-alpha-galacturonidase